MDDETFYKFLSSNAQDFIEEKGKGRRIYVSSGTFLSSNAQDFIEDGKFPQLGSDDKRFLSSNAQDFIEDVMWVMVYPLRPLFLSSNAQDFIEEQLNIQLDVWQSYS